MNGPPVSASAASAELRDWIVRHLDPLDGHPAAAPTSDFDLSPAHRPPPSTDLTPASVLIGLIEREEVGYSVLLTRRVDTLRRHAGQIAFPGGRIDSGEDAVAAALREANEEVLLAPESVEVAGTIEPYRTVTGYIVTPVIGVIPPDLPLKPHEHEVADLFEAPLEDGQRDGVEHCRLGLCHARVASLSGPAS